MSPLLLLPLSLTEPNSRTKSGEPARLHWPLCWLFGWCVQVANSVAVK